MRSVTRSVMVVIAVGIIYGRMVYIRVGEREREREREGRGRMDGKGRKERGREGEGISF